MGSYQRDRGASTTLHPTTFSNVVSFYAIHIKVCQKIYPSAVESFTLEKAFKITFKGQPST